MRLEELDGFNGLYLVLVSSTLLLLFNSKVTVFRSRSPSASWFDADRFIEARLYFVFRNIPWKLNGASSSVCKYYWVENGFTIVSNITAPMCIPLGSCSYQLIAFLLLDSILVEWSQIVHSVPCSYRIFLERSAVEPVSFFRKNSVGRVMALRWVLGELAFYTHWVCRQTNHAPQMLSEFRVA